MNIKLKGLLVCAAFCVSCMTGMATVSAIEYGEYTTDDGTLNYMIYNDEIKIMVCDPNVEKIVIPEKIQGYPVTEIEPYAFLGCENLKEISIPDTVEYIYDDTFADTAWYKALPDGEIYINNVFYDYKGKMPENTSIKLKEGTVSISPFAFADIDDEYTLNENSSLVSIEIPDSVKTIGYSAFDSCVALDEIISSENLVCNIEYDAFLNTAWYNAQPDGLVYFNDNILYRHKGNEVELTEAVVRDGTKVICDGAFFPEQSGELDGYVPYQNLKSVTLPEGLEIIGDGAFMECYALKTVDIPDSVTEILPMAFYGCESLSEVNIPSKIDTIDVMTFAGCGSLENIVIPDNVKCISDMAFYMSSLKSVELPASVKEIGTAAFLISSLENVTINNPYCIINYDNGIANDFDSEGNTIYNGKITGYDNSYSSFYANYYDIEFDSSLGIMGDVSNNGSIDLYDAIEIAKYMVNAREFDEYELMIADYNLNTAIDIYDVINIAKALIANN